jgi:hypothetical protein
MHLNNLPYAAKRMLERGHGKIVFTANLPSHQGGISRWPSAPIAH